MASFALRGQLPCKGPLTLLFLRAPWMGSLSGELLKRPGGFSEAIRAGRIGDFQPLFFSGAKATFSPKFPHAASGIPPACSHPPGSPDCSPKTLGGSFSKTNCSSPPPRRFPRPPLFVNIGRLLLNHMHLYGRFPHPRPPRSPVGCFAPACLYWKV